MCEPNPCKHNGKCGILNRYKFKCDCIDTLYQGETCEVGLVELPAFTSLRPRETYTFLVKAKPDKDLKIDISSSENLDLITPSTLIFNSKTTEATFQFRSNSSGLKALSYRLHGSDTNVFTTPKKQTLYVLESLPGQEEVLSSNGSLSQGCFGKAATVYTSDVHFHSTAPWIELPDNITTEGVLVMNIDGATLPASSAGSSIISDALVIGSFGDFIFSHNIDSSARGRDSSVEDTKYCVSERPSTGYLSIIVQVNAFAKTVADGMNQITPAWINLIPQQTIEIFNEQDFGATLIRGKAIKEKHKNCGGVIHAIEDDQIYYMYSTNQKMLMHFNDEDVDVGSGEKICIFRSVSENQTAIGFADASKALKTIESSTGWKMKANGLLLKNTSMNSFYRFFGQSSTEMSSDSVNMKISIDGNMEVPATNDTAVCL